MTKVSIATAARLMNKGQQFVRIALQRNLVPFGFAVKLQEGGSKYDYYINPFEFAKYLGLSEAELQDAIRKHNDMEAIESAKPLFQ